jgi:CrcB protein
VIARFLWVCFAGAVGTGIRYLTALAAMRFVGSTFPWATLVVNVVGCFLMSIVAYAAAKHVISPALRLTLATGFMGGLTTYSAFNGETIFLCQQGAWGTGMVNVAATVLGCVAAGLLGLLVARAWLGS